MSDLALARVVGALSVAAGGLVMVERQRSWIDVSAGGRAWAHQAAEMPVFGELVYLLALAVVVGSLVEGVVLGRWPQRTAVAAAVVLVLMSAWLLVICELAMSLIPTDELGWLLPTTVERAAGGAQGGIGTWATLGAAGLTVAIAHTHVGRSTLRRMLEEATPVTAIVVALAFTATGLATWVRYQPWAHGAAAGHEVDIAGAGLPWVGPASLVAVVALATAVLVELARPGMGPPLAAATAGWALSLAGAVTILVDGTFARFDARRLLADDVGEALPRVGTAPGAWQAFGTGLAVAVGAVGVLCVRSGLVGGKAGARAGAGAGGAA